MTKARDRKGRVGRAVAVVRQGIGGAHRGMLPPRQAPLRRERE